MNKAKKKLSVIQLIRIISQLIFFLLLPGLFINAFAGIKIIYTGILEHNFNFTASFPQLISAISIIPITLLLGRFFCGWMCAFGTMGDLLYFLSHKVFKVSFHINEKVDQILKYLKYVILVFLIVAIWSLHLIDTSALSPWDAFGVLADFHQLPDFPYVITNLTIGFLILLGIIVASLFVERFFCRYLCPLGAVFSIISRLKFVRIKKPNDKCGSCRACTKKCAMGIPLYKSSSVKSGECINCLKCVEVCPRKNVHVEVVNAATNPAFAGALAVTAMTGIYYVGSFAADQTAYANGTNQTVSSTVQNTDSAYKDGTYEGTGTGFRGGTTKLSVTIKGGKITDIEALSYGDDRPYFESAFQTIVSDVLSSQSADVDAVSGATFSSNGIMEAVKNALDQAENSNSTSTNTLSTPTVTPETTNTADTTDNSNAEVSSTDNSADTFAKKTSTASKSSSSSKSTSSYKYKDGVYQGSATGFHRGITSVSVTVKKDVITDIKIVSNQDTPEFFDSASSTIIKAILDQQSTNVDAVSGATFSSNGIMNAVADALSNAVNN